MSQEQLEKMVKLKAAKRMNELAEETASEQSKKLAEFAARGILHSGGSVKLIMNLALKRLDGGVRAEYEAFKEVYASAGVLTANLLRKRGETLTPRYVSSLIANAVDVSPVTKGLIPNDALEQMISAEIFKLRMNFSRDVEIDAGNLEIQAINESGAAAADPRKQYDVFLSFATTDREIAEQIAGRLKAHGLTVFFSPKELQVGDPWEEVIRIALVNSKELCLVVSKASLGREWVLTEWGAAWATGKRIAPVLVGVELHGLPSRLQSRQCIPVKDLETYALQTAERILGQAARN